MTSHLLSDSAAALFAETTAQTRGGAVNLDFDLTFVVQMVAFTVLVIVLKPILFDPLMKLFEERERRTDGAKLLARRMDERAGELLQRYESELESVRRAATEERERLRAEGQRLEAQILAEARAETAKVVEEGKAKLERERRSLRTELASTSEELARDIASRVLGREIS
jgi:F-type H+-transporting ATPase subunit b